MSKTNSSGSSSDSPLFSSNQSVNSSTTSFTTLSNSKVSNPSSKSTKTHSKLQDARDRPVPKYKMEAFSAWKSYMGDDEPDFEHIAWKKDMAGEMAPTGNKDEQPKGWKYWAGVLKAKDKERKAKEAKLAEQQR